VVLVAIKYLGPALGGEPDCDVATARTASRLITMFDLRDCRFEPFPFDTQLPRIEPGRIILPGDEPGLEPWSLDGGIELPIRFRDLTVGRFVLLPRVRTSGVALSLSCRGDAIALATDLGETIAVHLQQPEYR
jgi:hypothetical protein